MIITNSQLRRVINEELQIVLVEQRLELFEHEAKRDVDKLLREVELQDPRAGLAKVVDFSLGLLNKALGLIKSAAKAGWAMVQSIIGGVKAAWRALRKFCSKHKKICILIGGLFAAAIIAAVYMVLKAKNICEDVGGACEEALGSEKMDAVIGFFDEWAVEEAGGPKARYLERAADGLANAQSNAGTGRGIEILRETGEEVLKTCDATIDFIEQAPAEALAGDDVPVRVVEQWTQAGRAAVERMREVFAAGEAVANVNTVASGILDKIGGLTQNMDLGGSIGEVDVDLTDISDNLRYVINKYNAGDGGQAVSWLQGTTTHTEEMHRVLQRSLGQEAYEALSRFERNEGARQLRTQVINLVRGACGGLRGCP